MTRLVWLCRSAPVFLFALLLASVALVQTSARADEDPCALPKMRTDERPGVGGAPTEVTIAMQMLDLDEINDIKQSLAGDFAVILNWVDPRLSELVGCRFPLGKLWSPHIIFLNSGRMLTGRPEQVEVGADGLVQYIQRYQGSLATYHNLKDFPFDDQTFRITLFSAEYGEDDVQLVHNDKVTYRLERLNISDWKIGAVKGSIGREPGKMIDFYSVYHFDISAKRITAFYVWKVILPLCLIVAMSWAVFWINPDQFGPRTGMSATSMLTLIAFQFATTKMVPELGYFTLLDLFIGGATILVFLALLESLTIGYLVSQERQALALRIDLLCRWVFPLTFVALILAVFFL